MVEETSRTITRYGNMKLKKYWSEQNWKILYNTIGKYTLVWPYFASKVTNTTEIKSAQ